MKTFLWIIAFIFIFILLIWFSFWMQFLSIANFSFFQPKIENAKREVFENTQSYVEWKRQELTKYRLEYLRTKDEWEKQAIRMTIIQSFANFDKSKLNYELQTFLDSLN